MHLEVISRCICLGQIDFIIIIHLVKSTLATTRNTTKSANLKFCKVARNAKFSLFYSIKQNWAIKTYHLTAAVVVNVSASNLKNRFFVFALVLHCKSFIHYLVHKLIPFCYQVEFMYRKLMNTTQNYVLYLILRFQILGHYQDSIMYLT